MADAFHAYGTGAVKLAYHALNALPLVLNLPAPNTRELTYVPEEVTATGSDGQMHFKRKGVRPHLTLGYIINDSTSQASVYQVFNISGWVTVWPYANEKYISFVMRVTAKSKIEPNSTKQSSQLKITLDFESRYLIPQAPNPDALIVLRRGGAGLVGNAPATAEYGHSVWIHPYSRYKAVTGSTAVISLN
jgi:hypothetical protein